MSKSNQKWDFSGWATMNDLQCKDGRTIRKNAFADDDGRIVPLVWMHQHKDPMNVLGHALLENREEGVYAYCSFNDSPSGQQGKEIVRHGDVASLSIWANELEQKGGNVLHGSIKEVSVVLAGANPGAVIDFPMFAHSDEEDYSEVFIRVDEPIELFEDTVVTHSDEEGEKTEPEEEHLAHEDQPKEDPTVQEVLDGMSDKQRQCVEFLIGMALSGEDGLKQADEELLEEDKSIEHADEKASEGDEETVKDVLDTMTDEQKKVTEYLVAMALQSKEEGQEPAAEPEVEHSDLNEGEEKEMKTNTFEAFDEESRNTKNYLSHADGVEILKRAKEHGGMSMKAAIGMYMQENDKQLAHAAGDDDLGFKNIATLFPEYQLLNGPAPETLTTDQGWITKVMAKIGKSPKSRLRVRFADARDISNRRAQGYTKGGQKQFMGNIDLLGRTVDPTTVYNLDKLNRDDIVDITDFDLVNYMYNDQQRNLKEELARQIMIGDGRNGDAEDGQPIDPTKIIPIWSDDELFVIHTVVDVAGMRTSMNGTGSAANFGDNYVTSEAVIQSLLYAMEDYKGSGASGSPRIIRAFG